MCNIFSNCIREGGISTDGMASLGKGQQQTYLVKAITLILSIYGTVENFVVEILFHSFLSKVDGIYPIRTIPSWDVASAFV